ncbi:MAG: hypothetical protein QM730_30875 [Anaerolineales bacterium]
MISSLKLRDASGWTMFIFGVLALLLGLLGLIRPELLLSILGFSVLDRAARAAGDYTIVFMTASSMASFNMGVYYILAALNDMKKFYLWTVPFRLVTFTIFTIVALTGAAPMRFIAVGLWEGIGALVTGLTLYLDSKRTLQPAMSRVPSSKNSKRK